MTFDPIEYTIENTKVIIVKTKHYSELESFLLDSEKVTLNTIQFLHRKNEFASTRSLRNYLFGDQEIYYNEFGAPYMQHQYISIAHTNEYVALAFSEKPIGIDIEHVSEKINRIFPKIASDEEQNWFQSLYQKTQLWTIKEAMFKHYQSEKNIFSMSVKPSPNKAMTFFGRLIHDTKKAPLEIHTLFLEELDQLVLSVAL